MIPEIRSVWDFLKIDAIRRPASAERLYRAIGESSIGIRAGYIPVDDALELLIEVPPDWSNPSTIPEWRGMGHEIINLRLPPRLEANHLRLFLLSPEHREIFKTVCEDLVNTLEGINEQTERVKQIEVCLLRWKLFFEKAGSDGLSKGMQQGLFAELVWMQHLLEFGIDIVHSVLAWKGCERGYHDFDLNGQIVEVKSTRTKEPRSVVISNERQLDDNNMKSLHLYVLTILDTDGGGITLPEQVKLIRDMIKDKPEASALFKNGLVSAGYLDCDTKWYMRHYIIKSEDLYRVNNKFPRIITLPSGVGDLKYRIFLAACEPFRINLNQYFEKLKGV